MTNSISETQSCKKKVKVYFDSLAPSSRVVLKRFKFNFRQSGEIKAFSLMQLKNRIMFPSVVLILDYFMPV